MIEVVVVFVSSSTSSTCVGSCDRSIDIQIITLYERSEIVGRLYQQDDFGSGDDQLWFGFETGFLKLLYTQIMGSTLLSCKLIDHIIRPERCRVREDKAAMERPIRIGAGKGLDCDLLSLHIVEHDTDRSLGNMCCRTDLAEISHKSGEVDRIARLVESSIAVPIDLHEAAVTSSSSGSCIR